MNPGLLSGKQYCFICAMQPPWFFFLLTNVISPTFLTGVFYRQFMTDTGAELESWRFLAVCAPIVVFFAPFGSFLSSHFHRQVLAFLIYILDTVALVSWDFSRLLPKPRI